MIDIYETEGKGEFDKDMCNYLDSTLCRESEIPGLLRVYGAGPAVEK